MIPWSGLMPLRTIGGCCRNADHPSLERRVKEYGVPRKETFIRCTCDPSFSPEHLRSFARRSQYSVRAGLTPQGPGDDPVVKALTMRSARRPDVPPDAIGRGRMGLGELLTEAATNPPLRASRGAQVCSAFLLKAG